MSGTESMTHESRLARVEGAEPTQRSVQVQDANPTPMSTNNTSTQSHAVFKLNDGKWLNESDIPEKIHEYLLEDAIPTKRWFKARYIAEKIGESSMAIGPALAAMYRSEHYPEVVDRRQANGCKVYRVEVDE